MELSLSWIIDKKGGYSHSFNFSDIEGYLDLLSNAQGSITLDRLDNDIGPTCLQVMAENGFYLLTMDDDDGDEIIIRSYNNRFSKNEMLPILGDLWNARSLLSDLLIVKKAFKQFYESGNVSHDILN